MTDEEKFRFDLSGFLVRPAILSGDEVAAIVDQIDRMRHVQNRCRPSTQKYQGAPRAFLSIIRRSSTFSTK